MSTPNFLLLLSDQHRPDFLSINSDIPVRNPNIAKLASEGVNFSQAFCASPTCTPSRACLASGKSYQRVVVPSNYFNYPLEQPTFYGILREAGYYVAGVGKFDSHKPDFACGLEDSHLLEEWGFSEGVHVGDIWFRHPYTITDPTPIPRVFSGSFHHEHLSGTDRQLCT